MDQSSIPIAADHLLFIEDMTARTASKSSQQADEHSDERQILGTSLSALYQAATCHRKCHRGQHILEALCGRVYNLGSAAYLLAARGFYDEALNLIRSIGEISNLISMSVIDKAALREWIESDKKTRLNKFSPARVRKLLEQKAPELLIANQSWYAYFCEEYTHVTAQTKPNVHNAANQRFVGGIFQTNGLSHTMGELATVLGSVAMLVCKYFEFDDLFDDLYKAVEKEDRTC